jgi:hypothetical protein
MNITPAKDNVDIIKIKQFLLDLGFVCHSFPTASNLIYVKNRETIIIKNYKLTETTKSDQ